MMKLQGNEMFSITLDIGHGAPEFSKAVEQTVSDSLEARNCNSKPV